MGRWGVEICENL